MLRFPVVLVESRTFKMTNFHHNAELQTLVDRLNITSNRASVDRVSLLRLPANRPPWQATGVTLHKGQSYSLFARGRVYWTEPSARQGGAFAQTQLYGEAGFHLWARVSNGGVIQNVCADSGSFVADCDGELELGIYMGMWADHHGRLDHTEHYQALSGELVVAIAAWRVDASQAIFSIDNRLPVPPLIVTEQTRLTRNYCPPKGWHYLTETGNSDIFHAYSKDRLSQINVDAQNAQGIIRYPVDVALTPGVEINWQWRLDEHPSIGPEDRARFHDYVSLALEFDNGRDLTWIWSRFLDRDHHFHCPVKDWTPRETHYVLRTKHDALNAWCYDKRNVYADVEVSQGPPPSKIVAVWLIAVATFSHRRLRASFKDIHFSGDNEQRIL